MRTHGQSVKGLMRPSIVDTILYCDMNLSIFWLTVTEPILDVKDFDVMSLSQLECATRLSPRRLINNSYNTVGRFSNMSK